MKILIVLLAVFALAVGREIKAPLTGKERSVASIIVDYIEEFKTQMPCGFPEKGIPILAPLKIVHKEVDIQTGTFSLQCTIHDFRMDGLDNFTVEEFKANPITSKLTYKFVWHDVHYSTIFDLAMHTGGNIKWDLALAGNANFGVKDVIIEGSSKYTLGLPDGNVRLKDFYVYISIGEVISDIDNLSSNRVINRLLNDIIEEWIMLAVNENNEYIAEAINMVVVPIVNDRIGDQTLNDILNNIGGGSGGETGGEKEPCIPPEDA